MFVVAKRARRADRGKDLDVTLWDDAIVHEAETPWRRAIDTPQQAVGPVAKLHPSDGGRLLKIGDVAVTARH